MSYVRQVIEQMEKNIESLNELYDETQDKEVLKHIEFVNGFTKSGIKKLKEIENE